MYLIVGLGNPTKEYEHTRHNMGFDALERIAEKYNIKLNENKFKGIMGKGMIAGEKVILLKPMTYINLSGSSIQPLAAFFKIEPENIIVLVDDIHLPQGKLRIRKKGSAGGHNGLKDIIARLSSDGFMRIRIGVGEVPEKWDQKDWVLSRPHGEEKKVIDNALDTCALAVEAMIKDGPERAMNLYN